VIEVVIGVVIEAVRERAKSVLKAIAKIVTSHPRERIRVGTMLTIYKKMAFSFTSRTGVVVHIR